MFDSYKLSHLNSMRVMQRESGWMETQPSHLVSFGSLLLRTRLCLPPECAQRGLLLLVRSLLRFCHGLGQGLAVAVGLRACTLGRLLARTQRIAQARELLSSLRGWSSAARPSAEMSEN